MRTALDIYLYIAGIAFAAVVLAIIIEWWER